MLFLRVRKEMLKNLFRNCQITKNVRKMDIIYKKPKVSYSCKIKKVTKSPDVLVMSHISSIHTHPREKPWAETGQ